MEDSRRYLLLMGSSERKHPKSGLVRAIELYTGVSAPAPMVKGVRISGGALYQSQAVVYVRADGSVMEGVSSS